MRPSPRNEPNVHKSEMRDNEAGWRGSQLSLIIAGDWRYYRSKILKYLRQIAVITPYAQFRFRYAAEDPRSSVDVTFARPHGQDAQAAAGSDLVIDGADVGVWVRCDTAAYLGGSPVLC